MAWDFSTEPEFEEKLDVDARLRARRDLSRSRRSSSTSDAFRKATDPLKQEVKDAGPVGRAPAARAGRRRVRPGEARADARDPRARRSYAPVVFGNNAPDSGNAELLAIGGRRATTTSTAKWLQPLLDGKLRSAFSMTEPRRRRRPHAAQDARGARRRRVGDQRPQVVHVERLGRRLPASSWRSPTPTCTRTRAAR